MRASQIIQALTVLVKAKEPAFLSGSPGIGKSQIVRQVAKSLDMQLTDIRAVLLDPVDLRGIPHVNGDGRAHWCPPDFLPKDGNGILFLDELPQANASIQSACLQITLDRRCGEYELPSGWTVVAAGNRVEDRSGSHRLISALASRFVHLDFEVSNEDWKQWAIKSNVSMQIISFLDRFPKYLNDFKPDLRSFPCPRSWEKVSRLLPDLLPDIRMPLLSGILGEGPAAEFVAFLTTWATLPTPAEVLANPSRISIPSDPSALYAMCGMMAWAAKTMNADDLEKLGVFNMRLQNEMQVLLLRDAQQFNRKYLPSSKSATSINMKFKEIIAGVFS